jgi:hypothetical protein
MSEAVRYICVAQLDGRTIAFLWESGDGVPDRVVLDDAGCLLVFPSEAAARQASASDARSVSAEKASEPLLGRQRQQLASEFWCDRHRYDVYPIPWPGIARMFASVMGEPAR